MTRKRRRIVVDHEVHALDGLCARHGQCDGHERCIERVLRRINLNHACTVCNRARTEERTLQLLPARRVLRFVPSGVRFHLRIGAVDGVRRTRLDE